MSDPYVLLGVSREAGEREVRTAYRTLVRRLHPDLQPEHLRGRAGESLKAVNDARAQVLQEIRRRPRATSTADPTVPRQRTASDHDQWAARQEWLARQRRVIDEWETDRASRVQRRRRLIRRHHARRRGVAWVLAPLLLLLALQVVVALGVVHGVEALGSFTLPVDTSTPPPQIDLQELLARWGSWRS